MTLAGIESTAAPAPAPALAQAERLGVRVTQAAIWHEGMCNWIGAEPAERAAERRLQPVTYRALAPDLYAGTAGIALFLGELHAATGDPIARTTAIGAIRQACAHAESIPPPARGGLYTGWVGIAYVAARLAQALDAPQLRADALSLLGRLDATDPPPEEFDLMSGRAGAVCGLLALRTLLDEPALLERAHRLGTELLASARRTHHGYSWRSSQSPAQHDLTGFSHGTAGAAHALLNLFAATGEPEFRIAAEGAFAYERHWFSPSAKNWPDFRIEPGMPRRRLPRFLSLWCHGAPGIALSRLRAFEVLRAPWAVEEATIALETTAEEVRAALASESSNFSLCHGLCGNAEVLRLGADVLGRPAAALVEEVAATGIDRHGAVDAPWPCGTLSAETPNLMLGLGGIGLFYLRLGHPSTPSILMLGA